MKCPSRSLDLSFGSKQGKNTKKILCIGMYVWLTSCFPRDLKWSQYFMLDFFYLPEIRALKPTMASYWSAFDHFPISIFLWFWCIYEMTGAGRNKAFISKSADNDIVAVCLSCAGAACREAHCLVITRLAHCPEMEINYRKQSIIENRA